MIFLDSDDELRPDIIKTILINWNDLERIGMYDEVAGFYFLCENEQGKLIGNTQISRGDTHRNISYDDYLQ